MTVKELKEALAKYPDDMEVFIFSDEEGNDVRESYEVGVINTDEWDVNSTTEQIVYIA